MTVSVALIQPNALRAWEHGEVARLTRILNGSNCTEWLQLVNDVEGADLVVLLESCLPKTRESIAEYAKLPFGTERRIACINYEDSPPGFLPGLYSSLERYRFEPSLHISWPHLRLPNELADQTTPLDPPSTQSLLFSFSGSCSHPLRRQLFDRFAKPSPVYRITEIKRWYNHTEAEKTSYVREMADSRFVLCPRGIASYSHRIIETLALGRVPVIIADDWVPFSIPEDEYYIRLPEGNLSHIGDILAEASERYEHHRQAAIAVYQKYFHATVRYSVAFRKLVDLYQHQLQHFDGNNLNARWNSRPFLHANGWTWDQRAMRRLRRTVASIRQRVPFANT